MERLMVIDGHSLMNRAYYAMGNANLVTPDGRPSGAVYNFYNILLRYLEEFEPTELAVTFDLSGPTFRHNMFEDYKAGRSPMPDDLSAQFPMLRESLEAAGITYYEIPGYEADDLIGTLSMSAGPERHVFILSGDRDTLQLVNEHVTQVMPQNKGQTTVYDPTTVEELHGIKPEQVIELKALMGDSSDNIPGVKGIGVKTATSLLQNYGDLDTLYQHLDDLPAGQRKRLEEGTEDLELSKKLAEIDCKYDLEVDWDSLHFKGFEGDELYEIFKGFGFEQLIKRLNLEPGPDAASEPKLGVKTGDLSVTTLEGEEATNAIFRVINSLKDTEDNPRLAYWRTGEDVYHLAFDDEMMDALEKSLTESVRQPVIFKLNGELTRNVLEQVHEMQWTLLSIDSKSTFKALEFYPLYNLFDVEVAAYFMGLLDTDRSLVALGESFLTDVPEYQSLLEKVYFETKGEGLADDVGLYFEGQILHQLAKTMGVQIREQGANQLSSDIEMPLIAVLAMMENQGIRIDKQRLEDIAEDFTYQLEELEEAIYDEAGREFNINSPKQLGELLFDQRKLTPGRKTSKGAYSTNADELERLRDDDPIVEMILDYRRVSKFLNTSIRGLSDALGDDKRVHSEFNQTVAATGRLSSTNPNLQNIPVREEEGREIRRVFVAEDGWLLLDADYSQIELRLLAALSGDEAMLHAFRTEGDIHRQTAASMFHVDETEVNSYQRGVGKTINFSIIYGISAFGLARDLRISREEAQGYINRYYERYPGVRKFMDNAIEHAKDLGYVETLFGRRRYIPELKSKNYSQRQFGERVAMNTPIQGTAADIIKFAMVRAARELRQRELDARLVLQIHDELIIEAPDDEVEEVATLMQEAMVGASDLQVPLVAEVVKGKNWLDME